MTAHPLVKQLRFTRSELLRCLEGVSEEDAVRRIEPMNSLSWILGHLADQENRYWLLYARGIKEFPGLNEQVGYHKPPSTPPLAEMRGIWQAVTRMADDYLETLTGEVLQTHFVWKDKPIPESVGTMLMRNIYHYWFHLGEAFAIRQMLGHQGLPEFVGDMSAAVYSPES